ncbi:hypothetical protein VF14_18205 [Nostoc linckia z18]|nr:hypothetical protein [Nostoc linckia]PHK33060.1 hypothetical protein VF14_18205 [Nostoc linckia z18]
MTNQRVMTNQRGKRGRTDYQQVSGYIPRKLARALRIALAANDRTQSDVLEELIAAWVKENLPPNFDWDAEE